MTLLSPSNNGKKGSMSPFSSSSSHPELLSDLVRIWSANSCGTGQSLTRFLIETAAPRPAKTKREPEEEIR